MEANSNIPREVRQLLDNALTVAELIDILKQYEPGAKAVFSSDYGDRCHTLQATPIASIEHLTATGCFLAASSYSNSGVAIEESDSFDDIDDQAEFEVIVLS